MSTYLERYAYPVTLFSDSIIGQIKISIIIPCFNEPDILTTLNSLNNCNPVDGVEVIIIVNEPQTSKKEISNQNKLTLVEIEDWQRSHQLNFKLLTYHLIAPDKDAGVGLARKVGMDEAVRRFEKINHHEGVICCFDADSTCAPNYLQSIYQNFYKKQPKPHGAAVYFEHTLPEQHSQIEGIIQYELHLRYYVHALRLIGYPYAHQTVGSSMIVRSDKYQKIGGMNKRKAGEDFYFLHRLMPTGNFIDINDTKIFPSARISDRVPFGTGKAMDKWQKENPKDYYTYNLQSFLDLEVLFKHRERFFGINESDLSTLMSEFSGSVRDFLLADGFIQIVDRLNTQSSNLATFVSNWYQYFDGFKVLKYLHYSRDNYQDNKPVTEEATKLAQLRWPKELPKSKQAEVLLDYYRQKDRLF
ncbi:MAG: hypothetical protein DRI71_02755 [Bacteroidetes bacterium]|nr:MAG: hypothetical protein DRI71_02755 [Bacteroidota bacterium]